MFTVIETLLFEKQWPLYWSEEERGEFAAYIADSPNAGDVVPKSGGIRKVRWRSRYLFHANYRRGIRALAHLRKSQN